MKEPFALGAVVVIAMVALAPWACGDSGNNNASPDASAGGSSGGSSDPGSDSGSGSDGGVIVGPDVGASVLQVGHDVYHRMTYTQPVLTHAAVSAMAPDTTFNTNATFPANGNTTGQGLASVLYLESGPAQAGCPSGATGCTATARAAGAGIFLAFPALAANPNVYAFDETTGLVAWAAHVTNGGATNGSDGIRGTPAIDTVSRRVFIVTGNNPHTVHALSLDTGVELTSGGWPVTLSQSIVSYADAGFNSTDQNQRGGLLLVGNTLYIPFGGEDGDGGNYRGWVVAIDITNPTSIGAWATLSPQSGIWASGGLASDGTNIFAETGNTGTIRADAVAMSAWDSEEVVRLSGLAKPSREATSVFVANEWKPWDQKDLDFGSSSPAVALLPPGSNPPSLVIAPAKAGTVYVLNGSNLSTGAWPGNAGGELAKLAVANINGSSVYTAPTIYGAGAGLHTAIGASGGPFGLCPDATKNVAGVIVSIQLNPGQSPIASVAWCAANEVGTGSHWFPPISTTTDGANADPIVWFLSKGSKAGEYQLTGVNGDNGDSLVQTTGAACATVPSLSFPIVVKGRVVVAAIGHLCSWSIDGK